MKKSALLLTALSVFMLNACENIGFEKNKSGSGYNTISRNIGFKKTKSGLEYKIISGENVGENLAVGDVIKVHYRVTYKDSMIVNSYDFIPAYAQVDSAGIPYDISEIFTKLKVGDSAVSYQLFDSLEKIPQFVMPPYMKKGDKQQVSIKILAAFKPKNGQTAQQLYFEDSNKELEKYKSFELNEIEKYLKFKKINAQKFNNDIFYIIDKEGTGRAADSGKVVGIKYNGYDFSGVYFDSNIDTRKQTRRHPLDSFYFQSKTGGAIQGMLLGITKFKKGSVGRIFIPSILGYGPQGNPPAIKPNQNLIFDIEVVDVFSNLTYQPSPALNVSGGDKVNMQPDAKSTDGAKIYSITPDISKIGLSFNKANGSITGVARNYDTTISYSIKGFVGNERVAQGQINIAIRKKAK